MKLGIGLYNNLLNKNNYQFAHQAGCTHVIAHLANYYTSDILPTTDGQRNYGICDNSAEVWSLENLIALRQEMQSEGLTLHAIENFSPSDWYDILLDGPKKQKQMEHLKRIIANVGKAGIPVFGYNFSIAGVWGHTQLPRARGGALTACFNYPDGGKDFPIPNGQVWNMTYDINAPTGFIPSTSADELWQRYTWFLNEILPVAEENGVRMAAHPDDPPMPEIRGHARLVHQPRHYRRMLEISPSPSNCIEFCMGSVQEMGEGNVYEAIAEYAPTGRMAYVHFRNVHGKVPHYQEMFVDDGDIDMLQALRLLKENGFNEVLIPDHTPQLNCAAPWHSGMAYALGYMKLALRMIEREG